MVEEYKKVVVALEFNESNDRLLLAKAHRLLQQGAKVYCVHAVEYLSSYGAAYGISAGIDVEDTLLKEARESMKQVGQQLGIDSDYQVVKLGPAKFIILEEAESVGADLIIVGSHGRHGVRLLLGSTANAVLHSAKCDVLAIRVQD